MLVLVCSRTAKAEAQRIDSSWLCIESVYCCVQPIHDDMEILACRFHAYDEFIASDAADNFRRSEVLPQQVGHLAEEHRPGLVPQRIVDRLQVIEVDEENGERRSGPAGKQ